MEISFKIFVRAVVAGGLVMAFGAAGAGSAETYALVCKRSQGDARTRALRFMSGSILQSGPRAGQSQVLWNFRAAQSGTDSTGSGLQAGQCAWKDRGLAPSEPSCLTYWTPTPGMSFSITPSAKSGVTYAVADNVIYDNVIKRLVDLVSPDATAGEVAVFNVFNNGTCMEIAGLGK